MREVSWIIAAMRVSEYIVTMREVGWIIATMRVSKYIVTMCSLLGCDDTSATYEKWIGAGWAAQ